MLRMSRIRVIGLAAVAVFALSAVASASAFTNFKAKPTGGIFPAKVLSTGGVQTFTNEPGKEVVCKKATATGEALKEEETTTKQLVEYTECTADLGQPADNIHASYLIHANGEVDIEKEIVIHVLGLAKCEVKVLAQTGLKEILFDNNAAKTEITALAHVQKIRSVGTGVCGSATEATAGTYKGTLVSKLESGGELFAA